MRNLLYFQLSSFKIIHFNLFLEQWLLLTILEVKQTSPQYFPVVQYILVLVSNIKYPSLVAGGTGPDPKITEAWTPRAVLTVGYLVPNTEFYTSSPGSQNVHSHFLNGGGMPQKGDECFQFLDCISLNAFIHRLWNKIMLCILYIYSSPK